MGSRSCCAAQTSYFALCAETSCWRVCKCSDDDLLVVAETLRRHPVARRAILSGLFRIVQCAFLATCHPMFRGHGVVAATSCNCLQTDQEANLAHNRGLLMQPFANRQGKSVWLWSTGSDSSQPTAIYLLILVGVLIQLTGVYRSSLLGVHLTVLHHFYMGPPASKHPHLLLRVGLGNHPGSCRPCIISCVKVPSNRHQRCNTLFQTCPIHQYMKPNICNLM